MVFMSVVDRTLRTVLPFATGKDQPNWIFETAFFFRERGCKHQANIQLFDGKMLIIKPRSLIVSFLLFSI
jgi:hypothetical protein